MATPLYIDVVSYIKRWFYLDEAGVLWRKRPALGPKRIVRNSSVQISAAQITHTLRFGVFLDQKSSPMVPGDDFGTIPKDRAHRPTRHRAFTVIVDEEMYETMKARMKEEGKPLSVYVRAALRAYARQKKGAEL